MFSHSQRIFELFPKPCHNYLRATFAVCFSRSPCRADKNPYQYISSSLIFQCGHRNRNTNLTNEETPCRRFLICFSDGSHECAKVCPLCGRAFGGDWRKRQSIETGGTPCRRGLICVSDGSHDLCLRQNKRGHSAPASYFRQIKGSPLPRALPSRVSSATDCRRNPPRREAFPRIRFPPASPASGLQAP